MTGAEMRIAVCLACYNRKSTTLRCLRALNEQALPKGAKFAVYVLDDASPDGTGDAVRKEFPGITVLEGNGALFWGGGMRMAFGRAIADRHDLYLWLNDDVELRPGAILGLVRTRERSNVPAIIVGASRDSESGAITYSGRERRSWNPLRFALVEPDAEKPVGCETMNGNIVLIPHEVTQRVGNIDRNFVQQMGDVDYGLRARRAGISVLVAPGVSGFCKPNARPNRWKSRELPLAARLRLVNTPLGLPFRDWFCFSWRWGGILGLVIAIASYRGLLFPARAAKAM